MYAFTSFVEGGGGEAIECGGEGRAEWSSERLTAGRVGDDDGREGLGDGGRWAGFMRSRDRAREYNDWSRSALETS